MPTRHATPLKANFGQAMKSLRSARGVTQEDLINATSRRHIGRIEQGQQIPSIRSIESLATSLQIHPLTLVAAAYCSDLDAKCLAGLLSTVQADLSRLTTGEGT